MNQNFFDYFTKYAAETPEKILLRIDDNTLSYREFMEKTAVFGSAMKKIGLLPKLFIAIAVGYFVKKKSDGSCIS